MSAAAMASLHRTLAEYRRLIHLGPPVVREGDSLVDVVNVLSADPRPGLVLVVDDDEKLAGWVLDKLLETDLTLLVLPDLVKDASQPLQSHAARGLLQTAGDLMTPARSVTIHSTVKDALGQMVEGQIHAVALVDEQGRLLGYVTLLEIMREMLTWGG